MARYQHFEELPAWQEAASLYSAVLDLLELPNSPLPPGFRGQLDRAALAVSNNIAAGFEGPGTERLLHYLDQSRNSAAEIRSMLAVIAPRPRFLPLATDLTRIRGLAESCTRQLSAWMAAIEKGPSSGRRPEASVPVANATSRSELPARAVPPERAPGGRWATAVPAAEVQRLPSREAQPGSPRRVQLKA